MSAATVQFNLFDAAANGNLIPDPGSGGTIDMQGRSMAVCKTTGAGTRKLPNVGPGAVLFVVPSDTTTVTLTTIAGTTVAVIVGTTNTTGAQCVAMTSSSWAASSVKQNTAGVGGTNAAGVSIADAGALTNSTNVESVSQALLLQTQVYEVPLLNALVFSTATLASAVPAALAVFANNAASNPGFTVLDSKILGVRFNNAATQDQPLAWIIPNPQGGWPDVVGGNGSMTVHVMASKTGATSADATKFTIQIVPVDTAALDDAGSDVGGDTTAMTGTATAKTVQHVTLAASSLAAGGTPGALLLTARPKTNTLNTDDVTIERIYITYAYTG